jgi:hypothetical protein
MTTPNIATVDQRIANQIGALMIENARLSTVVEQAQAIIAAKDEEIAKLKAAAANDDVQPKPALEAAE